jgi:cellulose biosynthesis protein BcsQ
MTEASPYVVLVTSTSAGVGKSTLASNLTVYFKALDEELPVAYASLEVDADVDAMFRLGARPDYSLADLHQNIPFAKLFRLGQFGVDYCAAVSVAQRPAAPQFLRRGLALAHYSGVLVLDAAGDSIFLPAAMAAADLVLVPVKDPAALPELMQLERTLLASCGEREQLWLLPSQLGEANHYPPAVPLVEFLRFAAQERGFQVLDELLSAEPLVAELAVKLAKPVLTRAPQSALHQQLKQIAALVLGQRKRQASFSVRVRRMLQDGLLPPRGKRINMYCPLCKLPALSGDVHYLEAFPARRRMLLHRHCVAALLTGTGAAAFYGEAGLTLVQSASLFGDGSRRLRLQVLADDLELLSTEMVEAQDHPAWPELTKAATGRCLAEIYRELFIYSAPVPVADIFTAAWYRQFVAQRRALRQACYEEQL